MKKLNIILDETTIINFPFLWKLVRRYYLIPILTPLFVFVVSAYFYYSQNVIYSTSVGFRSVADEADSPTSAMAKLLGEKTNGLSPQEVIGIAKSPDFFDRVSRQLVVNPKFQFMNFNSITVKGQIPVTAMFQHCKMDIDCTRIALSKVIPQFVSINQDETVDSKFHVVVKTLDPFTSSTLLNIVREVIVEERIMTTKHFLNGQKKISEDILRKKKLELDDTNYMTLGEDIKSVGHELENLQTIMIVLSRKYEEKKYELSKYEITLNQTEESLKSGKNDEERDYFVQRESLRSRIKQITQDINTMEINKEGTSAEGAEILAQLRAELQIKKADLGKFKALPRAIASSDQFVENKEKASSFTEFDLNVIKREFNKIKKEYDETVAKKEELFAKKIELDKKMDELRPQFEYLKLLEGKVIQLQLLDSTVLSDLVFEKNDSGISRFKRATKEKIGLYSIFLIVFLMFIGLLLCYLLDRRIYDEYELRKNFEDLAIIGNTPDFS